MLKALWLAAACIASQQAFAANDWLNVATVSMTNATTPKLTSGYVCYSDGTDILCDSTTNQLTIGSGGLLVNGDVTANRFFGDGSGLTGVVAGSSDRIVSGTTSMIAISNTGYISLTQSGVNTGWFNPQTGFVTIGVSSTGTISGTSGYFSGNLGLGVTNPTYKLDVNGNIAIPTNGYIADKSNSGWYFFLRDSSDNTLIGNNNRDAIVVKSTGLVGMGTLNPSQSLHILSSVNDTAAVQIAGPAAGYNASSLILEDSGNGRKWQVTNRGLQGGEGRNKLMSYFYNGTAWFPYMTLDTSGYLGLNTVSPTHGITLDGSGQKGALRITNGATTYIDVAGAPANGWYSNAAAANDAVVRSVSGNLVLSGQNTTATIAFTTGATGADTTKMFIASAGNVGIGTVTPTLRLDVKATSVTPTASGVSPTGTMRIGATDGNVLDIGSYPSGPWGTWLQATDAGNLASRYPIVLNPLGGFVGIGTSSPATTLTISGSQTLTQSGNYINFATGDGGRLYLNNTGPTYYGAVSAYALSGGSNMALGRATTPGGSVSDILTLRLDTNRVGIGVQLPTTALEVSGTISATNFVGNGSGLTGVVAASGDRIVSGTTSLVADGTSGYVSLTQSAVNTGWFNPQTGFVTIGVSSTGPISGTAGYFSGRVGIGTTSPNAGLEIGTSYVGGKGSLYISPTTGHGYLSINAAAASEAGIFLRSAGNDSWQLYRSGTDLNIGDATATRMTFKQGGNVGIGTTAPSTTLHVASADQPLNAATPNAYGNLFVGSTDSWAADKGGSIGLGGYYGSTSTYGGVIPFGRISGRKGNTGDNFWDGYLAFETTNNSTGLVERMRISSAGNVGIGTATPTATLQVSGTFAVSNTAQVTTPSLYVNSSGYVGVGTSAPSSTLDIFAAPTVSSVARSMASVVMNSDDTYGLIGIASRNAGNPDMQVGVYGAGRAGVNGRSIGGYFTIDSSEGVSVPSFNRSTAPSAALVANNGAMTDPIFIAQDNGSTTFVIKDGGNVGIGWVTPSVALEVSGTVSATRFVGDGSGITGVVAASGDRIVSGTTSMVADGTSGYISVTQSAVNTGWFNPQTGFVTIGVSSTGRISGTSGYYSGKLGIGTSNPTDSLEVFGGNVSINGGANPVNYLLKDSSAGAPQWAVKSSSGRFTLAEAGVADWFSILKTTGYVGVNTAAPTANLQVNGTFTVSTTGQTTTPTLYVDQASSTVKFGTTSQFIMGAWGNPANYPGSYFRGVTPTIQVGDMTGTGLAVFQDGSFFNASHVVIDPSNALIYQRTKQNPGAQTMRYLSVGSNNGGTLYDRWAYNTTYPNDSTNGGYFAYGVAGTNNLLAPFLRIAINNTPVMSILSGSVVGINLLTPTTALEVSGTISATSLYVNGLAVSGGGTPSGVSGSIQFNNGSSGFAGRSDLVVSPSGSVGFGTSTPAYPVDVSGTARATSSVLIGSPQSSNGVLLAWGTTAGNLGSLDVYRGDGSNQYMRVARNAGLIVRGDMPIGFASSGSPISGAMDAAISSLGVNKIAVGNGTAGDYSGLLATGTMGVGISAPVATLQVSGTFIVSTTGQTTTPSLYVSNSGNVGIGTRAPNATLDVNGTISATNLLNANLVSTAAVGTLSGTYVYGQYASFTTITIAGASLPAGSGAANQVAIWTDPTTLSYDANFYWDVAAKRLGIGNSGPSYPLDVKGTIRAYATAGNADIYSYTSGVNGKASVNVLTPNKTLALRSDDTAQLSGLYDVTSSTWCLAIDHTSGKMGIGTATPSAKLDVAGSISATQVSATDIQVGSGGPCSSSAHEGKLRWSGSAVEFCDGSSWVPTGATTTPGGATGNIQFNDGGAFGGQSSLTFNSTTNVVSITGTLSATYVYGRDASFTTISRGGVSVPAGSGSTRHIAFWSASNTLNYDFGQLYYNEATHKMGIGNIAPSYPLDVNGTIRSYSTNAASLYAQTTGNSLSAGIYAVTPKMTTALLVDDSAGLSGLYNNTSSTWAIAINTAGGEMGISNSNPKATLDIGGTVSASDAVQIGGSSLTCSSGIAGAIRYSGGSIQVCNGTVWSSMLTAASGLAGDRISTSNVASGGALAAVITQIGGVSITLAGNAAAAQIDPAQGFIGPGVSTTGTISGTSLYVSGNIAIGKTTAGAVVDMITGNGTGTATETYGLRLMADNTAGNTQVLRIGANKTGAGTGYSYLQSAYWGASNSHLVLNPNGGNVAIGHTNPKAVLDVSGSIMVRGGAGLGNIAGGRLAFNTESSSYGAAPAYVGGYFDKANWYQGVGITFNTLSGADISGQNGLERMRISSDGFVGISTTNPSSTLHVSGTFMLGGTGSDTCSAAYVGQMRRNPSTGRVEICFQ